MRRTLSIAFLLCVGSVATMADNGRTPIPFNSPVATPITITEPGSYVLTRNMTASNSQPMLRIAAADVTIDMNGMVLTADSGSIAKVENGASATFFNGTMNGGSVAIDAVGAKGLKLDRMQMEGSSSFAVYAVEAEQVVVTRSAFRSTGDTAVQVESPSATSQVVIRDNTFSDVAGAVGLLQASSADVSDNRVTGVSAGSFAGGISVFVSSGVQLNDNVVRNADGVPGITVSTLSFGVSLQGNVVDKVANAAGINFAGSNGILQDNVVSRADFDGLMMGGSFNQVQANTVSSNGGFGLYFTNAATFNHYRLNTARGNNGNTGNCNGSATVDFCDMGVGVTENTSQGDNQLPSLN